MGILERASAGLGIPPEAVMNLAKIEICGSMVTVENYRRLLVYTQTRIVIDCRKNAAEIRGEDLSIVKMTDEAVFISGRIEAVEFKNL